MNYAFYISKTLRQRSSGSFTRLILRLAFVGIALSVAVMLIAFATVTGFKSNIIEKVTGFDGDLYVRKFDANRSLEGSYFNRHDVPFNALGQHGVAASRPLCVKAGIIRHSGEMEGLMFKGVDSTYLSEFMQSCMQKGQFPSFNGDREGYQLVISSKTAARLNLDTGQYTEAIFIQNGQVRRRRFFIEGIYNSGLAEHDQTFVFCDLRVIQRIVSNGYDTLNNIELVLEKKVDAEEVQAEISAMLPLQLRVNTAKDANFNLFEWLNYLDTNVLVILVLMFFVAAVNMLSAMVVLIIERTRMIGVLKALGAANKGILQIFWYFAFSLGGRGILLGNVIAWSVILLQWKTSLLKLDESIYYLDRVPFELSAWNAVYINAGVLSMCAIVLLIPVGLIQKVSPSKTLRFD